ncbi:MAG: SpaA isopeptide-forming pilin-related protein, partial [Bacillota bacterium]|nr:SpaA isopeptide-forming pilin-related protein [Bacillota bacterium]
MRENKLGVKKKVISRVFAITLSFLVAFSGINPAIFASADNGANDTETINYAVNIKFAPQNMKQGAEEDQQEVETGQTAAFVLSVSCGHANGQTTPVKYKVKIPDNIVQLPDFKDGDTFVSRATRIEFKLETDKDGYRYICGEILPGGFYSQPFRVFYPNGVTPDTKLTVTEDDIIVDKPDSIPGNIIKKGGTIHFKAAFAWEPLNITANVEKLKANAQGILTKDIVYTLTAESRQDTEAKDSGGIFTKEYTLTDVITLPAGITFSTGGLSWEDNNTVLMSGTMKVAEFSAPIESAQISDDGRTLTFVYKKINETLAEVPRESKDPKETEDLNIQVTLNRHALDIDFSVFNEDKTIDNNGTFNAVPCLEAEEHNSSDAVPIQLPKPGDDFEVEKNSIVNTEKLKNGSKIKYTITVRNNNPTPIVVDIKDSAPENTTYIDNSISDNGTVTKTATGADMLWSGVQINAGDYVTRSFEVTINSGLADGTIIKNTAEAVYNGMPKVSNTVEDKYYAPAPDLDVEKTNNKVNQMVSEGGTVTFTIKVTNNGDAPGADTITDTLSKHLVLDERTLPTRATYDKASRTISIPVALDPGESEEVSFKCKVQAASWLASGSSIGNTAILRGENERSTTSFLYKEKKHNLSVVKSMEEMVEREDLGDNWYQVSYKLTISNKGGPLWASQGEKVTDTMSGGLIPLEVKNDSNSRTAEGVWTTEGTSKDITAPIKKETLQTSDQYVTTWSLGNIAAGQKATIDYEAVVYLENGIMDMANTTNVAQIWKSSGGGSGVMAVPYPSSNKVISSINGQEPEDDKYCEIHPGDVITYKLTVKNTGTGTQHKVLLTDALPDYNKDSGFKWILGDNVKLEGNFKGDPEHSNDALIWRNNYINAKSTQTVYVTLAFPKGTMFDKAFSEDRAKVYNTFTFQTDKLNQEHKVTHDTVPVTLDITKDAENRMAIPSGEKITFTIDDFSTDYPVDGLKVTDNLEKVSDSLAATSILTGAYQISGQDNYNIILSYEGEKADKVINVKVSEGNKTITLTAEQQADLKSIAWDFGRVDSLKINAAPQLVMTAKDITKPVTVKNYVNAVYNQRMVGDDIEVKVMPDNMITKAATKGDYAVNNASNPLAEGDTVKFTMSYTNYEKEALDMTKVTIRDTMTVEGLKPNQTATITLTHFDNNGTKITNSDLRLASNTFKISQTDVNSPLAKRIDLKFSAGTLKAGEKVQFEYTVVVGEGFKDSMGDINLGYTDNYDGKMNLRALHNELTIMIDGESYSTQTDFYYREGTSQMYFQKGVFASGYVNARNHNGNNHRFEYQNMKSTSVDWINNINNNSRSTKEIYNHSMVIYSMVIYNNDSSPRNMTVDTITDQLPAGATFMGLQSLTAFDFSKRTGSTRTGTRQWSSGNAYQTYCGWAMSVPYNTMKASNIVSTSKKYNEKTAYIQPSYNKNTNLVNFTVKPSSNSSDKLVLKPGEMVVFAYAVLYKDSVNSQKRPDSSHPGYGIPKYSSYTNTAVLKTQETGFTPLANKTIQTKTPGSTKNDGGCTQLSSDTYESSVTVKDKRISAGLTKKAVARYEADGKTDNEIFTAAKNGNLSSVATKSTDMDKLGFNDIVEWEITLDYNGTNQTLIREMMRWQYGTITDQVPEPYRMISDSSGNNLIMEYAASSGTVKKVQKANVTSNRDAFFGEAGQTFVWQPNAATGNPAYFNITGTKITFRYYTRYDDSAGKAYINYNNVAKYEFKQRYVDTCTAGQPTKSGNKITAITAVADVFPGAGDMSGSYKTIEYSHNDATPTVSATSLDDDPKIEVPRNKVLVDYTLKVKNQSSEDYHNLVLIDRLPDEGDVGTVNSAAQRGSQFSVDLIDDPQVKVYLTDSQGNKTLLGSSEYTISYTAAEKKTGYTAAEWAGTDNSAWGAQPTEANSVRVVLNRVLSKEEQIDVVFKAYVTDEADPGEVAWGSFGYRFEDPDISTDITYAEPAKVGVQFPAGSLSVIKRDPDENRLAGAEFTLYTDRECTNVYKKNGQPVVIRTGSDGKGTVNGLALDTQYWIKETKAPEGYKLPENNLYTVTITSEKVDRWINGGYVTNEPEQPQGDFFIAKRVEGAPTGEAFSITVSGNFADGTKQKRYNLKDGEYAQVEETIYGETYTVTEGYSNQYAPQYSVIVGSTTTGGNKVTISEADCTVLIENHDKVNGSLYITKKVNGDGNGETFKINVTGIFLINEQRVKMTEIIHFTPDEYGIAKEVKNVIAGEEYVISEQGGDYIAEIKANIGRTVAENTIVVSANTSNEIEVINTETTEVSGIKTWNDGNNEEN